MIPRSFDRIAAHRIATLGLVAVSGLMLACPAPETPFSSQPANILLITIDTLRADHLSSYGYPRLTSPVLDRLAAEGVRFDQPLAQWPKTGPSFASLFSATYPKDNGIVRRVGRPVPMEFRMLAEVLHENGYSTHAVVANGALARELHYDQGFETYIETWKRGEEIHFDNRGDVVTGLAKTVAAEAIGARRPFFLWVHYIDPHGPYEPPEEWRDKFQGDEHYDPERALMVRSDRPRSEVLGIGRDQVLDGSTVKDGATELDFYVARYDAEIAYADAQIGELLGFLESGGFLDHTLTVVTSDHGESLGEHEYYFAHGRFGFETCLRVPLIVHLPGVFSPRVDPDPVELLHLAPTILEAAGVPLEEGRWMQGRSLMPRLLGGGARTHKDDLGYAFSEAGYPSNRRWQKIVRDRRYKLIYAPDWGDQRWVTGKRNNAFALFDLQNDPLETTNLVTEHPEETERLKRALHTWWNAEPFEVLLDEAAETEQEDLDDKTREQLKALGYLN